MDPPTALDQLIPSHEVELRPEQSGCAKSLKLKLHKCVFCGQCSHNKSVIKSHLSTQHPEEVKAALAPDRPPQEEVVVEPVEPVEPHEPAIVEQPAAVVVEPEPERQRPGTLLNNGGVDSSEPVNIELLPNFKLVLAGNSGAGKTTWIYQLLKTPEIMAKPVEKVLLVMAKWHKAYAAMKRENLVDYFIEFDAARGNLKDILSEHACTNSLIVFDGKRERERERERD